MKIYERSLQALLSSAPRSRVLARHALLAKIGELARRLASKRGNRLQNSPYFCVFKYARAVKQKVSNKAENRERDWGETLKIQTVFWNNSRTFYNLSEALGSFGFLPLRGAGTGFVVVLPLPLIFDPPLYILHFTIHYISQRTNAENCFRITGLQRQEQTITRAILPRNQLPSVCHVFSYTDFA